MAMDARDYLQLRCSEMLTMERDIWQMTNVMARECRQPRLKALFSGHAEPTRQQISNLEQVVDELGGIVGPEENPVTGGMMHAHRLFLEMNPPQALIDLHNAMEGEKIEHMEIAAYSALIMLARQLNEPTIMQLLEQNMASEERMRAQMESDMPALLDELVSQRKAA